MPARRIRTATLSDSRSSSARIDLRIVDIGAEGLLRSDAVLPRRRRPRCAGPGPRTARAGACPAPARRRGPGWAPGWRRCRPPSAARAGAGAPRSSPPPPTAHRPASGAGRRRSTRAGTSSSPSGLQREDAILAMNLLAATPTEQVMPCSSCTWARISLGDAGRPPEPAQRLDTSRNASSALSGSTESVTERKTSMTAPAGRGVGGVVGGDDDRGRSQPARPAHRHRRVDAERPGLVGGRQHHAPVARAADDHRLAHQLRDAAAGRRRRRRRPCRRAGWCSRRRRSPARCGPVPRFSCPLLIGPFPDRRSPSAAARAGVPQLARRAARIFVPPGRTSA